MVKIDRDLVYLTSENARMRIKDIAVTLKKSPQRLKYSISTLQKEKIIKNPFCLLDYSYFGVLLFRVYFQGGYVSEKDKETIINKLSANPYIISVCELTGEFDLAVEFAAPNPSRFNKEIKKVLGVMPGLNNYKVILNLVTYIYPKQYLTRNAKLQKLSVERIIGGDRNVASFNTNELSILRIIVDDPLIRMTALAEKTGLNIKTCISIMKGLASRNIIKGFKQLVDTNKLGIKKSRLFLRLHNITTERELQLMEFMLKTDEVVQLNKTVGDWDLEIDLEALDSSRVRMILLQLRQNFKDIIETFNLIEVYDYHKRSYLPRYVLEKDNPDQA